MAIEGGSVLRVLEQELARPVSFRELLKGLAIEGRSDRDELKRVLRELIRDGSVVKIRGGRFGLPRKMNLVVGTLRCSPRGYGFVVPERRDELTVFVREAGMGGALHGDEVVARIERRKPDGRVAGSVIRVVKRANKTLLGRLRRARGYLLVEPIEPKILADVIIPPDATEGAEEGMIVEVEILEHPGRHRYASGRIVGVVGRPEDPGIDFELVMRLHRLPREFPPEVREAARACETAGRVVAAEGRRDFRSETVVTIDGETARDFDDAISIARRAGGGFELGVHIADVSHYVTPGGVLDTEARARSTSVYFPGYVIPMLPEELSNGLCSLNPHVDRLVLSAVIELDASGGVIGRSFHRGIIRSAERMTYTAVEALVVDRDPELRQRYAHVVPAIDDMAELARLVAARRRARGSIDFNLPESEIVLDVGGEMTGIRRSARLFSHNLIEEFMILANEVVASSFVERGLPCVFRAHEPPAETDVTELNETLLPLGYKVDPTSPLSFADVMAAARGKPEERFVNTVCLRSMRLAVYQAAHLGHFGLASEAYGHFTSPIRRYPDLVLHRLVKAAFLGGPALAGDEGQLYAALDAMAVHCSRQERLAADAEREYIERKKVRFMADKVGEVFDATISGVESFGLFVELNAYFVDGLVHLTSLHDDYYIHDQRGHKLVGEGTGRSFRLGERVSVEVAHVNLMRRQIDFRIVAGGERAAGLS